MSNPFIDAQQAKKKKRGCKLCAQVHQLDDDRFGQFYAALLDRHSVSNRTIAEVLTGWGVETSEGAVSAHRRGDNPGCVDRMRERVT